MPNPSYNQSRDRFKSAYPRMGIRAASMAEVPMAWNYFYRRYDFGENALDPVVGAFNTKTNGTGAADIAVPATQLANGVAELDAGTDDNGYSGAGVELTFQGQLFACIAVRVYLSAVTTVKCEVGWSDSYGDAGAVNVLATPSYTATDAALWVIDTDDSGNSSGWQGVGIKGGTGITKLEPSVGNPSATTYQTLVVALRDTWANYLIFDADHNKTYESGWQANAMTKATLLTPWVFVQNRSGNQRKATIDFVEVFQLRSTGS